MKMDILLFTQTMHSLLASYLSLQEAIKICSEILINKKEKLFVHNIYKKITEGKKFSHALRDYKNIFNPLYIALVSVGEESGTLAEVFEHLAVYLKNKKNMHKKIIQALMYPVMVLFTAIAVVFILLLFVMPRLKEIFEVFSESSENITVQMNKITNDFFLAGIIVLIILVSLIGSLILRKINNRANYIIDTFLLKIPFLNRIILTIQMNDFAFSMKLLTESHFPLVDSLRRTQEVLSNKCIKNAVTSICKKIADGQGASEAFASEKVFPQYITVWIKIAEENGNAAGAFYQISDYYQNESDNILNTVAQAAEPVFILITGAIIIGVIIQFLLPVFNLLGAL